MARRSAAGSTTSASGPGGLPTSLDVPLQLIASDTFYSEYVRRLNFTLRFEEVRLQSGRRSQRRTEADILLTSSHNTKQISEKLSSAIPSLQSARTRHAVEGLALRRARVCGESRPKARPSIFLVLTARRLWWSASSKSQRKYSCEE
jgi:hypothetical protein